MANYEKYLEYLKHVDDVSKETHREEIRKAVERKEKEIAELKEFHNSEKESLRKQAQKDKADLKMEMASAMAKSKEELEDFAKAAEEEKKQLAKKYEDKISKLKADIKDTKDQIEKDYSKEIETLKKQLKEWRQKCSNMVSDSDYQTLLTEKASLEERLKQEVSNTKNGNDELIREYEDKIGTLENELKDIKKKYANTVSKADYQELQRQHEIELASLRNRLNNEITENDESYLAQFEKFKIQVSDKVKQMKDEISTLKLEIEQKDKIIYDLNHRNFIEKAKDLFNH